MQSSLPNSAQRLTLLQKKLEQRWFIFEEYYDLYYLTQLKLSKGVLIVGKKIALFVDGKYEEIAKAQGFFEVWPIDHLQKWLQNEGIHELCFDGSKTTYDRFLALNKEVLLRSCDNPVKELRMVKSLAEVDALERSAELLMKGFLHMVSALQEGVREKEIAQAFELYCLKAGADKLSFEPIVAFGSHSAQPHYRAGAGVLKKGDVILIDVGVTVADYVSDMTRTFFFKESHPALEEVYDLVMKVYEEVVSHVRPGISTKQLDVICREYIQSHSNYPVLHSVGHSLGLEVHEYPSVSIKAAQDVLLQSQMVITIEPGIYIPGVGGVRYENMLLIEENGFRNFYQSLHMDKVVL